jgi:gas vesicle protein
MFKWLMGALMGGALVYFFDPQQGQRRRDEAMGWVANMMEQSPDRLQGISQAAQDQWQGLSSNVSQRVSQMRSGATPGSNNS